MGSIYVEESKHINAAASKIYGVLADYENGHPAILPQKYFKGIDVVEGGTGAGTKMKVHMIVMGSTHTLNFEVTEPQPGKVLMERDIDRGTETSFTVDATEGDAAQVTIATTFQLSKGVAGFFERLFMPSLLRRIYKEELQILADYVQ